jgi:tetratricopeptide (TPR) repeat protein
MLRPLSLLTIAALALPAAAGAAPKRPDLTVGRATLETGAVQLSVRNAGKKAAGATTARVSVELGTRQTLADVRIGRLRPGKAATVTAAFVAPSTPGTHPVTVCADAGAKLHERNERNNCRSAGQLIVNAPTGGEPAPTPSPTTPPTTPGSGVDLAATDVSDPPGQVTEGGTFGLDDTVAGGAEPAPASTTRFYLSPDGPASLLERKSTATALGDVAMGGRREVPALAPNATSSSTTPTLVTVPPGTRPGTYFVLACADDREAVAEADEGDNCVMATHPEAGQEKPSLVTVVAEAQDYRIDTFSESYDPLLGAGQIDPTACAATATGSFANVASAIVSAHAFLEARAPAAMAAFASSPEYNDPLALQEAAGAAVIEGAPAAALAALLRAHELQPDDAAHLVNAAPIATGLGLPAEALAFLDGARRLDDTSLPAMGIGRHAVALANRGQALAYLGRYGEAERALNAALAAEPLLAEAQGSLAMVDLCAKQNVPGAMDHLRLGAIRVGTKDLDASRGRASSLRNIEFPGLPSQAVADADFFLGFGRQLNQESTASVGEQQQIQSRIDAKLPGWSPAQRNRYTAILKRVGSVRFDADVKAQRDAFQAQLLEAQQETTAFWVTRYGQFLTQADAACAGSADPHCFDAELSARCRPATNLAHQTWLDEMEDSYALAKTYYAALSKRMSGYAANYGDPDAYALALVAIQREERNLMMEIVDPVTAWTRFATIHQRDCITPAEPTALAPPAAPAVDGPGACPPLLSAISAVAEVGPVKVKISCEQVKVEASTTVAPWIKAFAEVGYSFKGQQVTVVAGAKAEAGVGVAKGSFKSGIYTVIGNDGVRDVGWRVGPSFDVSAGPLAFKVKNEVDISFMGAARPAL